MKKIIVKWVEGCDSRKEMKVIYSDHERFVVGSIFGFGFLTAASGAGFIIEIYP